MTVRRHHLAASVAVLLFTSLCAALVIFPYYWMIVSSVSPASLFEWPPHLWPRAASFTAYERIFTERPVLVWLENTAIVATCTAILCTIVSINAGYALSRFRGRLPTLFGVFVLVSQMLPATLIVVPLYVIFRQLGLYNTLTGLAMADTAFTLPLATWLMRGFFDRIPADLEQQAQIDGCSRLAAFYRVTLPLAVPGLVVVAVFSFISGWDEFFLARTLIASQDNWVLSVGLTSFEGQYSVAWDEMMATSVVFALPVAIFFLIVQRYLVEGMTSGALKG
jgi:multiple sugar transport system permease protein